jgi:hypothetical protein
MVPKPTAGVHWWTASITATEDVVEAVLGGLGKREGPGGLGHPWRRFHESGAVLYCGSDRVDQPLVLNASGGVCEGWSSELLEWSWLLGARCTRVDLALDLDPPELARSRLIELHDNYQAGNCTTTMRRAKCIKIESDDPEDGWTVYFGGKHSALRLRVYDRRGPLRLEFQFRPEKRQGHELPDQLLDAGPGTMWRTLARRIDFKLPWYQELLVGPSTELVIDARTQSTFLKAIEEMRKQRGATLWAMQQAGIDLNDLVRDPEKLRGPEATKYLEWDRQARRVGYPSELGREVKRRWQE